MQSDNSLDDLSAFEIKRPTADDVDGIIFLAELAREQLGYLSPVVWRDSFTNNQLFIATPKRNPEALYGVVRFYHRKRDDQTTIYDIVVRPRLRNRGIGRALIKAVVEDSLGHGKMRLVLKCPEDLLANGFYKHIGFTFWYTQECKNRDLNVWVLSFDPEFNDHHKILGADASEITSGAHANQVLTKQLSLLP